MKNRNLLKLSISTLILSIIAIIIVLKKSDFKIDFDEFSLGILGSVVGILISFLFSNFLREIKSQKKY